MKYVLLITLFFFIQNCSKQKIVYICGDHICVNKSEAEQYFEENLSLEVKIIDKENKKDFDLVKLNLKDNSLENRKINIEQEIQPAKKIKKLNSEEIKNIKKNNKKKEKNKKIVNKVVNNKIKKKEILSKNNSKIIEKNNIQKSTVKINEKRKEIVDICTIIEKCSIDEIANYLLQKGYNKDFPNITTK
jgi:hypothetical protein